MFFVYHTSDGWTILYQSGMFQAFVAELTIATRWYGTGFAFRPYRRLTFMAYAPAVHYAQALAAGDHWPFDLVALGTHHQIAGFVQPYHRLEARARARYLRGEAA